MSPTKAILSGGAIELLYERAGLARYDLPPALGAAYGSDLGFERPRVIANFVASVDGVVALATAGESGHVISGGSDPDHFVMGLLRACADVVMVGAGTFRHAPRDLFHAEAIYPPASALYAEVRARLGLPPRPRFVLVTGSGAVDASGPALEGALVVTTARGEARLRSALPANAEIVALAPEVLRVEGVLALLRERGAGLVLTEGGPSLFAELVAARAVDELFVTTSPALFGRFASDGRKSLADGVDLAKTPLDLLSLRRHGSHLFARYGLGAR
jgi:riboflavin biosynthesis pyrimidine reductase